MYLRIPTDLDDWDYIYNFESESLSEGAGSTVKDPSTNGPVGFTVHISSLKYRNRHPRCLQVQKSSFCI
jgi:hypothetical protein